MVKYKDKKAVSFHMLKVGQHIHSKFNPVAASGVLSGPGWMAHHAIIVKINLSDQSFTIVQLSKTLIKRTDCHCECEECSAKEKDYISDQKPDVEYMINEETWRFTDYQGNLVIRNYDGPSVYSPDKIVARARSRLHECGYDLIKNNCEHFATDCVTGVSKSGQVDGSFEVGAYVAAGGILLAGLAIYRSFYPARRRNED